MHFSDNFQTSRDNGLIILNCFRPYFLLFRLPHYPIAPILAFFIGHFQTLSIVLFTRSATNASTAIKSIILSAFLCKGYRQS